MAPFFKEKVNLEMEKKRTKRVTHDSYVRRIYNSESVTNSETTNVDYSWWNFPSNEFHLNLKRVFLSDTLNHQLLDTENVNTLHQRANMFISPATNYPFLNVLNKKFCDRDLYGEVSFSLRRTYYVDAPVIEVGFGKSEKVKVKDHGSTTKGTKCGVNLTSVHDDDWDYTLDPHVESPEETLFFCQSLCAATWDPTLLENSFATMDSPTSPGGPDDPKRFYCHWVATSFSNEENNKGNINKERTCFLFPRTDKPVGELERKALGPDHKNYIRSLGGDAELEVDEKGNYGGDLKLDYNNIQSSSHSVGVHKASDNVPMKDIHTQKKIKLVTYPVRLFFLNRGNIINEGPVQPMESKFDGPGLYVPASRDQYSMHSGVLLGMLGVAFLIGAIVWWVILTFYTERSV